MHFVSAGGADRRNKVLLSELVTAGSFGLIGNAGRNVMKKGVLFTVERLL